MRLRRLRGFLFLLVKSFLGCCYNFTHYFLYLFLFLSRTREEAPVSDVMTPLSTGSGPRRPQQVLPMKQSLSMVSMQCLVQQYQFQTCSTHLTPTPRVGPAQNLLFFFFKLLHICLVKMYLHQEYEAAVVLTFWLAVLIFIGKLSSRTPFAERIQYVPNLLLYLPTIYLLIPLYLY